jgi:hypothetical protein
MEHLLLVGIGAVVGMWWVVRAMAAVRVTAMGRTLHRPILPDAVDARARRLFGRLIIVESLAVYGIALGLVYLA